MKKNIESKEELDIINSVENGKYISVNKEEFEKLNKTLKNAASNTIKKLSKRKAINIRLLETDIQKIKAMALNEGMPYQTYITHLIHKFATSGL